MKIFNTWKTLSFLLIVLLTTSCSKDNGDDTNPPGGSKGDLKIKFDHRFGGDAFALNQAYNTDEAEELTFTNIRYYISNIRLKRPDGSWWSEEESYYIVDASANPFTLDVDGVPSGTYTEISYLIGVDSVRNVSGSQTGALSPSESMFWSWHTGYVFIKMEGTSPQASDGDFAFHVGGFSGANNALHTNTHSMGTHLLSIHPDAVPQLHLIVDIKEVFDGNNNIIKISEMSKVHMPGPGAVMFAENFHEAFSLDHIHD